jgi:acetaldehyde dehydrogenase / alcohol dehydrogenase
MSFLDLLEESELSILNGYFHTVKFPKAACIMREGDPGEGCYFIDEGEVRAEIRNTETDSDSVLAYVDAGTFIGEVSLLDGKPRSASVFAQTEVTARWFSREDFDELCEKHPKIGFVILRNLGQDLSAKLRRETNKVAEYIFADEIDAETNSMVARAVTAQRAFAEWSEPRIDALLIDIAEAVAAQAQSLAEACVQETKMGVVADKVSKIQFASLGVLKSLNGHPAAGLLRVDDSRRVSEIASPMGVIFGLIPLTNPVSTFVFKVLISLKGRNSVILSCHRDALGVGNQTGELVTSILIKHNAPTDLVQWVRGRGSRKKTMMFMKHPDIAFILATGGPSMVKAAYSSGTPAIGVGAGNAPVLVCADADIQAAARMIVSSKSFDNGVLCGSENNLVVDISVVGEFIKALEASGAQVLTPDEKHRFMVKAFDSETLTVQRDLIGKSALYIAGKTDIKPRNEVSLIVVPADMDEMSGPLGHEKLAPMISLFVVNGESEGFVVCKLILNAEGSGHTANIHTKNQKLAERFALEIPASRILVNTPGSQGCAGICSGLTPSLVLGCGTYGGNSTTDNVTYTHLLNIKRMALSLE